MLVHMISCIIFFKGFYLLGKYYNNGTMAITSMLSMILLPLVSIMYLFSEYFNSYIFLILYLLLCIIEIAGGIGFLIEGYKRKTNYQVSFYTLAGVMIIVQTVLCLAQGTQVVNVGLIISLFTNAVTTIILYVERRSGNSFFAKDHPSGFQNKTV
jgi:NADH:ubiquinone oxidoreductase subunit K